MKKMIKMISLILAVIFVVSSLAACNGGEEKRGEVMSQEAYDAEYAKAPYINTNKELRLAGGYWPPPPGFGGNLIGAQVGDPGYYIYESMFLLIRGTDKIIPRLATHYENKGNSTLVYLRQDRSWNDGVKFTAKDLWAYYILMGTDAAINYHLEDIKIIDDYTLEFVWAEPVISDTAKELFFAEGWQAVTPYHIFGKYVDTAYELMKKGTKYTGERSKRPAFGLVYDGKTKSAFKRNYNDFKGVEIPRPVGTGPYMVDKVTNTECILVKNPHYPDKDKLTFNTLKMQTVADYNSLLSSNMTDSFVGTLPYDMAKNILQQSKEMVMYPIQETRCVGVLFDTQKEPFNDKTFRQALNYVLDKKPIREVANYWAIENDVATTGIIPSTMDKYVDPEVVKKITKYSKDTEKAAEMLESLGWTKNAKGKWQDKNGKTYKFVIAANGGWGAQGISAASEVAQQLTAFGLDTEAKAAEATVVVQNMKDGQYDMLIDFVDMTWNISDPYKTLGAYYGEVTSKCRVDLEGLVLKDYDGKDIKVKEAVGSLLYISDPKEYKDLVSRIVWATNDNALCINLYQNVMAIWENYHTQKGLPMEREIEYYNRMMPLPRNEQEYDEVAVLNRDYAFYAEKYIRGKIKPR